MDGSKLNHQAAETYCKSFSFKILDNLFSEKSGITGQQILEATPVKQVNFFILKSLFAKWQEETKKFHSPFFNYRDDGVKSALKNLANTLSKNIRIERGPFQELLEEAVYDTIFLICEPEQFYKNELLKSEYSQLSQSLSALSKYIKIHRGLFDALKKDLHANGDPEIFIENIETKVKGLAQANPSLWSDVTAELASFETILPISFLEQIEDPVFDPPPAQDSILDEPLETTIVSPVDHQVPEDLIEDSPSTPAETFDAERQIVVENVINDDINDEFEPITEEQNIEDDANGEAETSNILNDQYSEELPTVNDQFEVQIHPSTIVETHESQSISNLHGSININQRYMFLNDLFNGDVEQYEHALIEIEMSESFDDSVEILVQNYSKKYNWDMNSDEVKELLKVIFKKFR